MNNIYTKQFDDFLHHHYSSYCTPKQPSTIHNVLDDIQHDMNTLQLTTSGDSLSHDVYKYCHIHNLYLPGLVSNPKVTINDILSNQDFCYSHMIHDYILCIFTKHDILYPSSDTFTSACSYPLMYGVRKIVFRVSKPVNWKVVQSFHTMCEFPHIIDEHTILHLNLNQRKFIMWKINHTNEILSHNNQSHNRQCILQQINNTFIPDSQTSALYNNNVQFGSFIAHSYGFKQVAKCMTSYTDYYVKSNETQLYPIHIDIAYKTKVIIHKSQMHNVINHIHKFSQGANILCTLIKASKYNVIPYSEIFQDKHLLSLHIDIDYKSLNLQILDVPYILSKATVNLNENDYKMINKYINWSKYNLQTENIEQVQTPIKQPSPKQSMHIQTENIEQVFTPMKQPSPKQSMHIQTENIEQVFTPIKQPSPKQSMHIQTENIEQVQTPIKEPSPKQSMHIQTENIEQVQTPIKEPSPKQSMHIQTENIEHVQTPIKQPSPKQSMHIQTDDMCIQTDDIEVNVESKIPTFNDVLLQMHSNNGNNNDYLFTSDISMKNYDISSIANFEEIYSDEDDTLCDSHVTQPPIEFEYIKEESFPHNMPHANIKILNDSWGNSIFDTIVPQFTFKQVENNENKDQIDDAVTPWDITRVMNDNADEKLQPNYEMKKAINKVIKKNRVINAFKKSH